MTFGVRILESPGYQLSYGAVCVILRLAVLVQCRLVTDGQTDGRTHDNGEYPR